MRSAWSSSSLWMLWDCLAWHGYAISHGHQEQARVVVPLFNKGGCVLTTVGSQSSASLERVLERRVCQILDSGGTVEILSLFFPCNSGPHSHHGPGGCMGVHPASPHVFCGPQEGFKSCPLRSPVRNTLGVQGSGLPNKGHSVHVWSMLVKEGWLILFEIFIDSVLAIHSQGVEGIWFGTISIGVGLFADDCRLFASSSHDLQLSLEWSQV